MTCHYCDKPVRDDGAARTRRLLSLARGEHRIWCSLECEEATENEQVALLP